ncbi:hypothetical protein ACRE_055520 [Hapsidospora chrysogenum ATCC 11550]|uniref:Uncharacterized protein n=1 Tax=Hapsidospora chrysogenum (strain ATCC 11550 / CBS 779.69 / DSM 880 / IAM 14645 / JCM 23072 / IMI 49137) TaxID=857340 RepID=A0A086T2S0_HAPC1|nr:hypothetical protein ACRE_055520 [Hapsidospora chrysogenum ATCC 11550]
MSLPWRKEALADERKAHCRIKFKARPHHPSSPVSNNLCHFLCSGIFDQVSLEQKHATDPTPTSQSLADRTPPPATEQLISSTTLVSPSHRLPLVVLKGTRSTTALKAVDFVSDRDFSLRKSSHIINAIPPPAGGRAAEVA